MQYEQINPMSHAEAEQAVTAGHDELRNAIVSVALHDDDVTWAQTFCERFAQHPEPGIRGCALLGFGHLARRFRQLDERVRVHLLAGLSDPNEWVKGQAVAAADDVVHYLGWRLQ